MAKDYEWNDNYDDDWDYKPSQKTNDPKKPSYPQSARNDKTVKEPRVKLKNSTLSIIAIVFSFFPILNFVSVILAMIDLIKRNDEDIPHKHSLSVGALVIVGFNYLIIISSISLSKPTHVNPTPTTVENTVNAETKQPIPDDIFLIGEAAELNNVQVTLNGYYEGQGDDFSKPKEGNVFLYAEMEIANNTDDIIPISSMFSFEAYADDYAVDFSVDATISSEMGKQLDGEISPGKKMRGTVGYEVPADWNQIEIHFTDNIWKNNKFKFLINRTDDPMK